MARKDRPDAHDKAREDREVRRGRVFEQQNKKRKIGSFGKFVVSVILVALSCGLL